MQSVSCIKSYDRIVISWNPVESDGDNVSPWMHVTSSGNKVYMPQYWVKVHEGDSNTVMDFFTNETRFSTSSKSINYWPTIIGRHYLHFNWGGGGLIKNFFLNKKQSFSGFSLIRRSYVFVTDFDSNFQN